MKNTSSARARARARLLLALFLVWLGLCRLESPDCPIKRWFRASEGTYKPVVPVAKWRSSK